MKTYTIFWETDYCDDFPEQHGQQIISAEDAGDAARRFYALNIPGALIYQTVEVTE